MPTDSLYRTYKLNIANLLWNQFGPKFEQNWVTFRKWQEYALEV